MARFTVEVLVHPSGTVSVEAARVRDAAAALRSEGIPVRWVSSILIPGDELCLHLLDAPSAESVVEVGSRAGIDPIRVMEVVTEADREHA